MEVARHPLNPVDLNGDARSKGITTAPDNSADVPCLNGEVLGVASLPYSTPIHTVPYWAASHQLLPASPSPRSRSLFYQSGDRQGGGPVPLAQFLIQSIRAARQAKPAAGNIAVLILRDADRAFWTPTVWRDDTGMRSFLNQACAVKLWCAS